MSDYLEKLPLSVQQHLDRANALTNRVAAQHQAAESQMVQAFTALAQANSEHALAMFGMMNGKSTLSVTESTFDVETDLIEKKCLGITYHSETRTKTYQTMRRRDISLY